MHIWWCFFLAWFSCLEINCAENNAKGDENIGRRLDLWLLDEYSRDDDIAHIMAKRITLWIYRWIYYLMMIIVSITIVDIIIGLPFTVGLAIIVRKMRYILKRKKAFWQNIDSMIHKMKEKLLHAATKKREHLSLYTIVSKITKIKIQNWNLELSEYRFDVEYRPGKLNLAADALARIFKAKEMYCQVVSISLQAKLLETLKRNLGCPGITRLFHQVKIRNLPYSLADVTKICKSCLSCSQLIPKLYKSTREKLTRATQPFERIIVDFKGPLP